MPFLIVTIFLLMVRIGKDQYVAWCFDLLSPAGIEFNFVVALWHSVIGSVACDVPLSSTSAEALAQCGQCCGLCRWSDSQSTVRHALWELAAHGVLGELLSAVTCALRGHSKPSWNYVKAYEGHPVIKWQTHWLNAHSVQVVRSAAHMV